jgi:CO/xanthine dehydrogenase Mo-binding subunit
MGEPPVLPLVPVILVAIHDATGVWMEKIPVTPERKWRALHETGENHV